MRLIGSRVALDALAEHSAPVAQKFFGDLKGAFFKKPPFRVSFSAFSFCFFFFCAYLLKRKRRAMKSDETTERVTLRPGGGIWNAPLTVSRAACQTTGALWHRDLPDFCFRVRKNRKMLEKGDLFSGIRFARVFHSRVQNPTLPFFPSFTQFPQGFPQPFALFHRGGGGNVGNSGFPDRFSDNGKENGVFSAPRLFGGSLC